MIDVSKLWLRSSLDRLDAAFVEGWITLDAQPDSKLALEILLDGEKLGSCVADGYREDLAQASIGNGHCAFSFPMPPFVPAASVKRVRVRLAGTHLYLDKAGTPDAPAESAGRAVRDTVSRFGGLWIDRADFIDQLAAKHRAGAVSDLVCDQILHFVRDGYVVLPGAVSAEILDALNADIDAVWQNPPDGLRIETFEPDGVMKYVVPDIAYRAGATKLLDLYAVSAAARAAIAAPQTVAFLAAIFEHTPRAFQGLTFWNGSQQAIHKDTAYVKIDSNPLNLAATWLALEDISPGTGELEYYVGSHRAPDFLFGGTSKWMESFTGDHDRFLASLHEDARYYAHVKGKFLAKAGDVLVWHADLAHGGAKIERPGQTRRSLVTHFCPAVDEPFYRRTVRHKALDHAGVEFMSQYGDISE